MGRLGTQCGKHKNALQTRQRPCGIRRHITTRAQHQLGIVVQNELKLTSDQLDELQRAKRLKFINGHTYELFLKLKGSKKYLHVSTQNYNASQTMNRINVIITILNLILTFGLIIHHLIKNKEKTPWFVSILHILKQYLIPNQAKKVESQHSYAIHPLSATID